MCVTGTQLKIGGEVVRGHVKADLIPAGSSVFLASGLSRGTFGL